MTGSLTTVCVTDNITGMKKFLPVLLALVLVSVVYFLQKNNFQIIDSALPGEKSENLGGMVNPPHPLTIEALRNTRLTSSELVIEEEIGSGSNYRRYIASYNSDGNKNYGLLTVPTTEKPQSGFPLVIFNHGYIPPSEYRTTERYEAYVDGFARNGYIVFRPDYRGHGSSEGEASGGYGTNDYTIDVLNALEVMKRYPDVDAERIGMWGHSMGGHITLRAMVVDHDIDAGVIWAGVVGSYPDLVNNWRRRNPNVTVTPRPGPRRWRDTLAAEYGTPDDNPEFWNSISSTSFLGDISGPVQIHHGTADESVPVQFSRDLEQRLKDQDKTVEYYEYEGDNHNISFNFATAIQRSVEFFDKYVKGT